MFFHLSYWAGEFRGLGGEVIEIGTGPPVAYSSLRIESAAQGIEGVADFVPYYGADLSITTAAGASGSKRACSICSRKIECVSCREDHCVYRLRRHRPFFPVNRFSQATHVAVIVEQQPAPDITERVVWPDLISRIIVPRLRIAHTDIQRRKLQFGLRFRCRGYPGQRASPFLRNAAMMFVTIACTAAFDSGEK